MKHKRVKSEYYGVCCFEFTSGEIMYRASHMIIGPKKLNGRSYYKWAFQEFYETEREAAIRVDKYLISVGKEPKNILKRKL